MMPGSKSTRMKRAFGVLEVPVIYSLTAITAAVGLLVYGTTLVRSGSDGGLLGMMKPIFGVPYSLIVGVLLIAILAINRRGNVLIVLVLGEILHLLILFSPGGGRPFVLDEHLTSAVLIACLLAFSCIHFDLVEPPIRN